MHDFKVVFLEDTTGGYVEMVSASLGCHIQGEKLTKILEKINNVIYLYWETLQAKEETETLKKEVVGTQKESEYTCPKFHQWMLTN